MTKEHPPDPRMVFIGGVFSVEPDLTLDTRLPIPSDYGDYLIRAAASSSAQWWEAAIGFAQILLDQSPHDDAWICVTGPAALRIRKGRRVFKPRLDNVFPGEATKLDTSDFRRTPIAPWTYVRSCSLITISNPCPITAWERRPPTAVIISCHDDPGPRGTRLIALASLWPTASFILLDCPSVVSEADRLRVWNRDGRTPLSRSWSLTSQQKADLARVTQARDKFGRQRPVVSDATFSVTRAALGDRDVPAERVAAAASFLQSRYDLSIDIWDIVSDPGLAALVKKQEADHVVAPGTRLRRVPKEFRKREIELEEIWRLTDAELADFPLGQWRRADDATLSWQLLDPELPVSWRLRVDSNSLSVSASATGGKWLPLEVRARPGWYHGLGWKIGIKREGHVRLKEFLGEYLDRMRPIVRSTMVEDGQHKNDPPSSLA